MPSALPLTIKIVAVGAPVQLGLGNQIISFEYDDAEKGDDMLRMSFSDPYQKLVDSEQFIENTEWSVQWGFAGQLFPARKVILKGPEYTHGRLDITALDKGSALRVEQNWDVAKNTTMAGVVDTIAKRHGLKSFCDSALNKVLPFFVYGGRTDWDVLEYFESRLANHVFRVVDDKLVFKERDLDKAPVASLQYRPDQNSRILEFKVKVDDQANAQGSGQTTAVGGLDANEFKKAIAQADEVTKSMTNLGNRRPNDKLSTWWSQNVPSLDSVRKNAGTKSTRTQGRATGKSLLTPSGSQFDPADVAASHRSASLMENVTAEFVIVAQPGDPFYRNGDLVDIGGIGKKFSGIYKISSVVHSLSEGYVYKMKCKRNAVNSTTATPAALLNGKVNIKSPAVEALDTIKKSVLGSRTGQIYGTLGRLF